MEANKFDRVSVVAALRYCLKRGTKRISCNLLTKTLGRSFSAKFASKVAEVSQLIVAAKYPALTYSLPSR